MKKWIPIAGFASLLYFNTLWNGLVFDDQRVILDQPVISRPWDLPAIFGGRYLEGVFAADPLYRPLTIWSLALNHGANVAFGLPGSHPVGFHLVNLVNLILYALVCCTVFGFLVRCGTSEVAFAAALLFVCLPVHPEAVAAVVNRSEILAAIFGLFFVATHSRGKWFSPPPVVAGSFLQRVCHCLSGIGDLDRFLAQPE